MFIAVWNEFVNGWALRDWDCWVVETSPKKRSSKALFCIWEVWGF